MDLTKKNKSLVFFLLLLIVFFIVFGSAYVFLEHYTEDDISFQNNILNIVNKKKYNLSYFYESNSILDSLINSIVESKGVERLISQLVITSLGKNGKDWPQVEKLLLEQKVGGIMLTGGKLKEESELVLKIRRLEKNNNLIPVIISFDGEFVLVNKRLADTNIFTTKVKIDSLSELYDMSLKLVDILNYIGVNQNFAPVCDVPVKGSLVEDRVLSNISSLNRIYLSIFTLIMQQKNIVATAKHFPGHGNVMGDSHKGLVYIDGDLKEINSFKDIIKNSGILSIMVGHIAIKNNPKYNTNNLPATLCKNIVTDLLKGELNFKGIVVTDAMNMGAVNKLEKPSLNAVKAGCDMILMPSDESKLIDSILEEIKKNKDFENQIKNSIKKIIKLKICLGLLEQN